MNKIRFIGGPEDGKCLHSSQIWSGEDYIRREYPLGNHLYSALAHKSLTSEEVAQRLEQIIIDIFLDHERKGEKEVCPDNSQT